MEQLSLEQLSNYPSSLPIRSPSPDTKNSNKLNKTLSPSVVQFKRQQFAPNLTQKYIEDIDLVRDEEELLRSRLMQSQKNKMSDTFGTQVSRLRQKVLQQRKIVPNFQYETQKHHNNYLNSLWKENSEDLRYKLIEKDRIITQLKKVLATMSQSEKNRSIDMSYYGNQYQLRERIKVLTIQNEKLGEMVRKLNRKGQKQNLQRTITENRSLENKLEFFIMENNQLEQKIERLRKIQNEEISELLKTNNGLQIQLKVSEDKIRGLQKQNQRLIKLLKQQRDSQKSLNNNLIDQQLLKLQNQNKLLKEKSGPERLTIVKIKQQYQENLKIFQERVYDEVNKEFQKMQNVIKNLEEKLNLISQRKLEGVRMIQSTIKSNQESPTISKFIATNKKINTQSFQLKKSPFNSQDLSKQKEERFQNIILKRKSLNDESMQGQFISLKLKQTISNEKDTPANQEERFNMLLQQYNVLRDEKKHIEQYLQALSTENSELKQINSQLKIAVSQQIQEYKMGSEKKFGQEIQSLKQQSKLQLIKIQQKYESEVESLKKSTQQQINTLIDTYNQQINMLRLAIESKNKDISEINKQIQIIQNNHIQLLQQKQSEIQNLKKELQKSHQQIQQFNKYRKNLEEQSDIRKRSYTELEVKFAFLNDTISKLTQQKQKLLTQVQSLQDENETLKHDLHDTKQENNMIPCLKEKIQNLENELLKIQEKFEQKKEQIKNINAQNKQLQQKNKNLIKFSNQLLEQKNNIFNLVNQIDKVKGNLNYLNLEELIRALSIKLNSYQQQNISLGSRLLKTQKQTQLYKKKVIQINQKIIDYQNQFKLTNLKIDFLTRSNEIKQQQCVKLKKLIDTYINNEQSQINAYVISQKVETQLKQLITFRDQYKKALEHLNNIIKDIKLIQNITRV